MDKAHYIIGKRAGASSMKNASLSTQRAPLFSPLFFVVVVGLHYKVFYIYEGYKEAIVFFFLPFSTI